MPLSVKIAIPVLVAGIGFSIFGVTQAICVAGMCLVIVAGIRILHFYAEGK